eukprot:TRINITY_DN214_c0_g1_i1.p1 TRINITY_DN214_c0_g1~~TRINITY_DN214_c0_g1_i1.p1  ORF type:complete len:491 (+),score=93.08 TRINITY_DN214_c0_g1_i1:85-1473(+)
MGCAGAFGGSSAADTSDEFTPVGAQSNAARYRRSGCKLSFSESVSSSCSSNGPPAAPRQVARLALLVLARKGLANELRLLAVSYYTLWWRRFTEQLQQPQCGCSLAEHKELVLVGCSRPCPVHVSVATPGVLAGAVDLTLGDDAAWIAHQAVAVQAPLRRSGHAVALAGSKAWLFGGVASDCSLTRPLVLFGDLWCWCATEKRWSCPATTGLPPSARWGHSATAAAADGLLILYGGICPANHVADPPGGHSADLHVLDLAKLRWEQPVPHSPAEGGGPMTRTLRTRHGHSATYSAPRVGQGGAVWLFGGHAVGQHQRLTVLNDLWRLDMSTKQWEAVSAQGTAPAPRGDHVSAAVGDSVLIFGGCGTHPGDACESSDGSGLLASSATPPLQGARTGDCRMMLDLWLFCTRSRVWREVCHVLPPCGGYFAGLCRNTLLVSMMASPVPGEQPAQSELRFLEGLQ